MKLQYQHVFSVGLFLAGLMVCSFAQAEPVKVIGDSPVTLPAMREPTIGILKPTYSPPTNGQEPKPRNIWHDFNMPQSLRVAEKQLQIGREQDLEIERV